MFEAGAKYNRQNELHDEYGGNRQSGISACANYPYIFLFSTPRGEESGYKDGWTSSDEYTYSGEGRRGNMTFTRGNLAIKNHRINRKEIHLFELVSTGLYKYVGEFRYKNHKSITGNDIEGRERSIIKFNLERI